MKKISWNHVFVALTFFVCIGVICWSAVRIDTAVTVSNPAPENDFTIVLDAGHGGIDGGCSTADGKTEKVINLNILLSVRDLGRFFGYNVEATREKDMSIHDKGVTGIRNQKISDMENRLAIFNKHGNSVCVSIHQNTFGDPQYSGAQMFYSDKNPSSERLASIMQQKFVGNLQPENQRETKLCGSELYLCYYCENPAVMVECGFLSNPQEAAKLTDEEYQQKVAFTIFSGINEFVQTNA
ncbi:MAG: cell wall hydrolase [Ruminococcus sp.]|nr:cell wall hydrolase [Ruminococcus sp.]